ncbi:MAG: histidinol dehydrogenase [Proteobacteria bacterium]|nr:histidinol dehydrogenase [Pseudomonadota bacterium]
MNILDWSKLSAVERRRALARPPVSRSEALRSGVARILKAVRAGGDAALLEFTRRFDGVRLASLRVSASELRAAEKAVSAADKRAMREAARRIETFHRPQIPKPYSVEVSAGVECGRRHVPIQSVGLYVPGGSARLPSTVLMSGVPARLAGCPRRVLATPPRKDGSIDPHILVAARLVGIDEVFKLGGAQAIAALAYGTRTVPKVDKIFGPGNAWVTEAKIQAAGDPAGAACEFPAGPSEVLVVADAGADPRLAASDLLAQAEHGPDSQAVLLSDDRALLEAAAPELKSQMRALPRADIVRRALAHSRLILVRDVREAIDVSNLYAPEHLILHVARPRAWLERIVHAGSVFLGPWSPEAAGDYASGPNHVLPTYGLARAYGGLTVESFMKSMTVQELSPQGLRELGPVVERLAEIEGLRGHARSVTLRLEKLGRGR